MISVHKTSRMPAIVGFVLIIIATCIAYLPAMTGGLIWDDDMHVPPPELRTLDGLRRGWLEPGLRPQYYPVVGTAFWLQSILWGDWLTGYHIVNLALHLVVVSLLYLLLRRLEVPGALLAAGIFALHPVHVESVAWISEQKNTLSTVFYLSAMLAWIRFDRRRTWRPYSASFVFFVLSLLTKTVTATLPAALLVVLWWKRGKLEWRRDVLPLVPLFIVGISGGLFSAYSEYEWVGARGANYDLSALQRVMLAGRALWFYVGELVWPANLAFSYSRWEIDPSDWTQWLYPIAAAALAVGLWAIRHRSRAPLAAFLFFGGTLFPALGFLNVYPFAYSYVADHFQYLASLGLIVLASAGIARLNYRETDALPGSAPPLER